MKKILSFLFIALVLFATTFISCKTTKTKTTYKSDSIRIKDSIVIKQVIRTTDSTVIKDTLIRIKYDRAEYAFPSNSTKDTAIRSGRATLRISVNNGIVTGQADCDSFDVLVTDLRITISKKDIENDQLKTSNTELKSKLSESSKVVKTGMGLRGLLGWVLLMLLIAIRMWRKKTLIFW